MQITKPSESQRQLPKAMLAGRPELVSNVYPDDCLLRLANHVDLLPGVLCNETLASDELADALCEVDYLMATWGMPPLNPALLAAAPNLKGVFYAAGSVKGFATAETFDRGIVIASAWRANALPVAEFSLGAILMGLKQVFPYARLLRETRQWSRAISMPGAYRSTVGLLSLGAIGRHVASLLRYFEIRVIAFDPYAPPEVMSELGVELVGLEALFSTADVVSVHTPWVPETVGLVDGKLLRLLKHGATFINTSRGAIINEGDLIEVLGSRPDLTAILDVTHPEPPEQDSPLWSLPNVVLTPHIAGSIGPEVERMGEWMIDELVRHLATQPLLHQVSKEMMAVMA